MDVWPPVWNQFVPDVIVALITGAAIGLALDLVQRRRAKRQAKSDAARSWSQLKSSLRAHFRRPLHAQVDSWDFGAPLDPFVSAVDDEPLEYWNGLLREPSLTATIRINRTLELLHFAKEELRVASTNAVRLTRPAYVAATQLSERHREAENAMRAIVFEIDVSAARISFADHNLSDEQLLQWARASLDERSVEAALDEYMILLQSLSSDHELVRSALA